MGNDDKGLLEDLIGESLEETQTAVEKKPPKGKGVGKMTPKPVVNESVDFSTAMDASMGDTVDDSVLGELVQRKAKTGNKRLFILIGFFLALGLVGSLVKFGFIPLPIPKALYNPKKELVVANKVTLEQRQKVIDDLKKKQAEVAPPPERIQALPPSAPVMQSPSQAVIPSPSLPAAPVVQVPSQPAAPVAQAPASSTIPPVVAPPVISKPLPPPVPRISPVENTVRSAPTLPAGGNYTLQVGAYLFKSSLKDPMAKIVKLGFEPHVKVVKQTLPMNKVFVGNFQSLKTAEAAVKELSEEGIQGKVETRSNGNFSALAGTYFYARDAQKQKKKLEDFGFDVAVEKAEVESDMQALRVGSYADMETAEQDLQRLKAQGLKPVIVSP